MEITPMNALKLALFLAALFSVGVANANISNASFEENNAGVGNRGYKYSYEGVTAPGWSFNGGSGVSVNNSAWHGATATGNYFAFLQNTASVSQSFDLANTSNLNISFDLAQRSSSNNGGAQTVGVFLNNSLLASFTPYNSLGWDQWGSFSLAVNNLGAGSHTLKFAGLNPSNARDTAAFLDNISATVAPVPEPETYALMGMGLLALIAARRRKLH